MKGGKGEFDVVSGIAGMYMNEDYMQFYGYQYGILTVTMPNNNEQKFIEQDRNKLFAFLQEKLQNKLLQFNVIVEEKNNDRPAIEATLSSKEQFLKIIEQYPLVKELKDRLRLELDY